MNKVIILGRLGKDPEFKQINPTTAVCNLNIATSETWKDKQGIDHERTEWHRVSVFGNQALPCSKHLQKGSQVLVEAKLSYKTWIEDDVKKYATEIIAKHVQFLDSPKEQLFDDTQQDTITF